MGLSIAIAKMCWTNTSRQFRGIAILSTFFSIAALRRTAHSTRSSLSRTMILPFALSWSLCPLLPMRWSARATLFGLPRRMTRSM